MSRTHFGFVPPVELKAELILAWPADRNAPRHVWSENA
jgi:hypothetical protein